MAPQSLLSSGSTNADSSPQPFSAPPILGRFFLVGCPRSGTTLLQSLLAAHPMVASFPESGLFIWVVGYLRERLYGTPPRNSREWLRQRLSKARVRLGIAAKNSTEMVEWFLETVNHPELIALFPSHTRGMKRQLEASVRILDQLAQHQGKPIWLEKSPLHLGYVDRIEATIPTARFIHIIREGPDTVASIYDVSRRYPEQWAADYPSLDHCIAQWNHCMSLTERYLNRENHLVVSYESLVQDPASVVSDVCRFLGIEYQPGMLTEYAHSAERVTRADEKWKAGVRSVIHGANGTKFFELFNEAQREQVLEQLASFPWAARFNPTSDDSESNPLPSVAAGADECDSGHDASRPKG